MVAVLVPIHAGDEHRRRAVAAVTEHYARHHAAWEFIVGEWHEHPWSKGAALGTAFRGCSADILVIADADSFVDPTTLELSVRHVAETSQWVVPHSNVYRLNEAETDRYYRTGVWRRSALHLVRTLYTGPAGGRPVCALSTMQGAPPSACAIVCTAPEQCPAGLACTPVPGQMQPVSICVPPA